jgi:UDP-glucuronate 4-epimerase
VDRVLVTGGLGFIGSLLCEALLDEGARVRCVDDLSGAYASTTGPAAAARLAARGAELLVASAHPRHVGGVDAVMHLAGRPGVRNARSVGELHAANVAPAERLAAAAARTGARFLLVSSSSVYGNAAELPTPEHAPPAPLNRYAASKVAAEAAVFARGGDPVVVRPFTVYGPGQRPDMAFARWIAALRAGDAIPWYAAPRTARDFTFVDDAVAGLMAALRQGRAGEAYNVSGGRPVPLTEALALLAGGEPVELDELPLSGGEALVTSGCGRKALAELGHAPRAGLEAGLVRQLSAARPGLLAA